MRLIDADTLLAKQANIAKTFARSDAQKSLMGRVMFNTENAPTIDAIPVEWLEEQADYARSEWDYDTCEGIRMVLKAWQKEQEADIAEKLGIEPKEGKQ